MRPGDATATARLSQCDLRHILLGRVVVKWYYEMERRATQKWRRLWR
jgi:hypothetical protein